MFDALKNTVCVVTGAAGGIGLGIARAAAENGAKVMEPLAKNPGPGFAEIGVEGSTGTKLMSLSAALYLDRGFTSPLQAGHQDSHQQGDDSHDHQEFNECESILLSHTDPFKHR